MKGIGNLQRSWILILFLAIMVTGVLGYEYFSMEGEIAKKKEDLSKQQDLMARASIIESEYKLGKSDTLIQFALIPQEKQSGPLLELFNRLAKESHVDIRDVRFSAPRKSKGVFALPCEFQGSGRLSSIVSFLYGVEENAPHLEVVKMQVSEREGSLDMKLLLHGQGAGKK
ncbi:MAG: hypothetical protein HYU64_02520 [Armatimonadetes bacterium]|nr:hypothetical protein [Armatimonadota bacterium]